ncbi:MAG: Holliday junction resolvase RuvX [Deltaproteobacteria bacterium]|nr:Holliday junction resolvase RuvX [Deltaproteobacteria bacterium]MCB9490373.1 Holliday junction resolvase RuvX [Deltaproteobacteria bacterium]
MAAGSVMAIDLGTVRIGVAVSDGLRMGANPLEMIPAKHEEAVFDRLLELSAEHEVVEFVVGLPLNMDGTESPGSTRARQFAEKLSAVTGKPAHLWDERLSSWAAENALIEGGVRREKRKKYVDKVAAAYILQSYLDAHDKNPPLA